MALEPLCSVDNFCRPPFRCSWGPFYSSYCSYSLASRRGICRNNRNNRTGALRFADFGQRCCCIEPEAIHLLSPYRTLFP
jgi:hypothetical protein